MVNSQRLLEHMCRACMCTNQIFHSLCEEATGTPFTIYEMVATTIPQVPVHSNDELPKKICVACLNTLIIVHKFQQMCITSDTYMRSLLVSNRLASHSSNNSNTTEKQEDSNHLVITQEWSDGDDIPLKTRTLAIEEFQNCMKYEVNDAEVLECNLNEMFTTKTKLECNEANGDNEFTTESDEVTHNVDWARADEAANFNPEGYKCNDCAKRFAKRESLSAHLQSHKKSKIIKETSKKTGYATSTDMFPCILCPKRFQKHIQLKRHSRTHADNKNFKCNLCDKAYSSNANLQDHINKHNGVKGSYVCKYCSKSFQQSRTLKDHVRIHTGEQQPYLCSECGRSFNSLSNLKQHLLRHASIRRYECAECPKKFRCLSDLASHMAVHKKNQPHICDVCGAAFGKPFHLKKHKMHHNGEKPHKCEYCEMRFVCTDRMRRHMRTHTGEKPFKCKYCECAFAQSNDLVKHLRSHIGE